MGSAAVGGCRPQQISESNMARERKDKDSLKPRRYRDEEGEVHHHTKSYMERHGERSGSAGNGSSDGQASQQRSGTATRLQRTTAGWASSSW